MFVNTVKNTIKDMLLTSKLYKAAGPFYSGIGSILTFHQVYPINVSDIPQKRLNGSQITPDCLENIIKFYINKHYDFVSIDEVYEILNKKKSRNKFVAFTFDDGYTDNLLYAYPILKKYSIPFTIYISTGNPTESLILWWFLLDKMIFDLETVTFSLDNRDFTFECYTRSQKKKLYSEILTLVLESGEHNYLQKIKSILGPNRSNVSELTSLLLTRDQINKLSTDPLVTIGAHTVNHLSLNKLSKEKAQWEILESKKTLESYLNKKVDHFAYPYGGSIAIGKREFELAQKCGFKTATTTQHSHLFFDHKEYLMCLPRIIIGPMVCGDIRKMNLYSSGLISAKENNFRRIVKI